MLQALRQPKWMIATVIVLALAAVFVRLGVWQLDRLEERRLTNAVGEQRIDAAPVDLSTLLAEAPEIDSFQYRRVTVEGEYDPSEEVLIRSQVELGRAGFHVITPLVRDDGSAVLVNRGWVPITMDTPPVEAQPPFGRQTVEGWVQITQTRPPLGQEEPPGDLDVLNRVDIERIDRQTPHELAPVYVVAMAEKSDDLPIRVDPPDFTDEGPHLGYAIQWFGFAAVALIGFFFLLRRKGGQPG
ncbi:MAG: SURF1 family protein [Actinomycetota bacterium]